MLELYLDRLVSDIRQALFSTTDIREQTYAAVWAYFDFIDRDPDGFRLVFESELPEVPCVRRRTDRAIDDCVAIIAGFLVRNSGMNPRRARMLAIGLTGIGSSSARYWLDADRPIPMDQAVATTAGMCWGGLSQVPLPHIDALSRAWSV
ncbi:hypothetical protein [Nocardia nepalensis]|uniref:hypothetical protein n=1 Tax=Nocardia nepalensis TaxID=3375448 RepID=UPI003B66CCF3